jgi:hypothetical protein
MHTEMVLIPNQIDTYDFHIFSEFGISSAGINTRAIRAPPVCHMPNCAHMLYVGTVRRPKKNPGKVRIST